MHADHHDDSGAKWHLHWKMVHVALIHSGPTKMMIYERTKVKVHHAQPRVVQLVTSIWLRQLTWPPKAKATLRGPTSNIHWNLQKVFLSFTNSQSWIFFVSFWLLESLIWQLIVIEQNVIASSFMDWLHVTFLSILTFRLGPYWHWIWDLDFQFHIFITMWQHLLLSKSGKLRSQINVSSGPSCDSNMEEKS